MLEGLYDRLVNFREKYGIDEPVDFEMLGDMLDVLQMKIVIADKETNK